MISADRASACGLRPRHTSKKLAIEMADGRKGIIPLITATLRLDDPKALDNLSEPVYGTGVPVLKVFFDAVSSCRPITRITLHLQTNFSEFSLDGRLPTPGSVQPVSQHWLMPELPVSREDFPSMALV